MQLIIVPRTTFCAIFDLFDYRIEGSEDDKGNQTHKKAYRLWFCLKGKLIVNSSFMGKFGQIFSYYYFLRKERITNQSHQTCIDTTRR